MRQAALLLGLAVALLAPSGTPWSTASSSWPAAPASDRDDTGTSPRGAAPPSSSPRVVEGADGWLYIAQDWTVPCQDKGQAQRAGAGARALAQALQASGRETVVTVGPDKSTVLPRPLPRTLPGGTCGPSAKAAVWRELTAGPAFLDLRQALQDAAPRVPTYWRKDTHWTPSAGAVYARALARRLDPALARRLRLEPTTYRRDGDLARVLGRDDAETVRGVRLVNPGVTAQELPAQDIGMGQPARRTRARLEPGARVLPGLTVFVGDSFDATALEQLAPLFEETLFFWPGGHDSSLPTVMRQVARADRVVVETVERFAQRYRMFDAEAVAAARRLPPRRWAGVGRT